MNLFVKYRISAARDSGQPLSPSLQRQVENSTELEAFAMETDAVETTLREQRPGIPELPSELHRSIMSAVRQQRNRPAAHSKFRLAWWLPVPAFAGLLVFALVQFWPHSPPPSEQISLWSPVSSVEKGMELARIMPQEAVAPLSEELKKLRGDVENAKAFLMASLP
jgi:hypothetical protein